jgi:M6 family metalloprotease-like protein
MALVALAASPRPGLAQSDFHPRWEIPGFDFAPDGVWRARARRVAQARAALLSQGAFSRLNQALAPSVLAPTLAPPAVTGVLQVPAILMRFADTPAPFDSASYDTVLFGTTPPYGRPYTIRTFYEQLSNGLFSMQGQVLGWVALSKPESSYTGGANCTGNPWGTTNCNGIFRSNTPGMSPIDSLQAGLREALTILDAQGVNWARFDGDSDGYVDMAVFVHPNQDGACGGNNNVWSHRYVLYPTFVTSTPALRNPSQKIQVRDYTIQSGVGGARACNVSQIMPIGTAGHESGHGLNLPDLYDIRFASEGLGEWGLMGSGNYSSPFSPSRMEAWSLSQLGWVKVAPLAAGTYTIGPVEGTDSVYLVPVQGNNPRGEYFLLENREALLADTALIRYHCQVWYNTANPPASCGGGLLVWHVDSMQVANNGFHVSNLVNYGPVHGVALEQADGLGNLDRTPNTAGSNRGDAGDPYPGVTLNSAFGPGTNPAATKNSDGSFVGFALDSIRLLSGNVSFRLRFGGVTVVRAADTTAAVKVDNVAYTVFRDIFSTGSVHQIAVDSVQTSTNQRTRFTFVSWSDGGARLHSVTGALAGATYVATLARAFKLSYAAAPGGTVSASPPADTSGVYLNEGSSVMLTATASAGSRFAGWSGDTTAKTASLTLAMGRPYNVTATFLRPLATADVVAQLLTGTSSLSPADLTALDLTGNNNGRFDVGDFLAWVQATGASLTAPQRALVAGLKAGRPRP